MRRLLLVAALALGALVPAMPAQAGCGSYPVCETRIIKVQRYDEHSCSEATSCVWTPVGSQNLKVRAYGAVATTTYKFTIAGAIIDSEWVLTESSFHECVEVGDAVATMSTNLAGRTTYTIKSNRARRADNTCNLMYIKIWYNPYI